MARSGIDLYLHHQCPPSPPLRARRDPSTPRPTSVAACCAGSGATGVTCPGGTPVYTDVVSVSGNGSYGTASSGNNPGGFASSAAGTRLDLLRMLVGSFGIDAPYSTRR